MKIFIPTIIIVIIDQLSKNWIKVNYILYESRNIIGDFITEINVTSPTGIREIKSHDSIFIEKLFWDFIEDKKLTNHFS